MMPQERNTHEVLAEVANTLIEILAELRRANSADRTGAVSSVQIEDAAKGPPRVTTKVYTGSEAPVDEAINAHAWAHAQAEQRWKDDWQATVDGLATEKARGA